MIRPLILAVILIGAFAFTAGAGGNIQAKNRARPTKEQKATKKELRDKYDKDKNGKLSKEERAAISAEDKAKLKELRAARKKAKGQ